MSATDVLGVFVGGRSRRMGGYPKGFLRTPDGKTLVEQHVELAHGLGMEPVLVGAGYEYRGFLPGVVCVDDASSLQGPIAGLRSLLGYAGARTVFTTACDMPRVDQALLKELRAQPRAVVTAARVLGGAKWSPFPARYQNASKALELAISDGTRSFQGFFRHAKAKPCELTHACLVDADTPEDASWLQLRRAPYWGEGASLTTAL